MTRRSSSELDARTTAQRAIAAARSAWGEAWAPEIIAVAPGRIEILGNHVDYNGGPVLAAAVDRATVVIGDREGPLELLFADFPGLGVVAIEPDRIDALRSAPGSPRPYDFAFGVIERTRMKHRDLQLGRMVVATSIPIGSGMSSSAALSVALSLSLNCVAPTGAELVYDAQYAENWTGVPCGTMDQSASVFGNVIRFEGPEGTVSIAPDLDGYCFVVVDSRVERTLGTSSYPARVAECERAVQLLEAAWQRPIGKLASLTAADLRAIETAEPPVLPADLIARTRHVVSEVARVAAGEVAMANRDWTAFGALMNESGRSSATDYAISHPRVEELVETMRSVSGVAGARMMGGGEGGSALALLKTEALDDLRAALVGFFDDESMAKSTVPLSFAPGARILSGQELTSLLQ